MLSQKRAKELLIYDKNTGVFAWRFAASNCIKAGSTAGTLKPSGYIEIKIDGHLYKAHRLAWLYVFGEFPENEIDHVNHRRSDNRISNLRLATRPENSQNKSFRKDNKSGFAGVHWCKREQRWVAQIGLNGTKIFVGYFSDPATAHQAYLEKKKALHPFQTLVKN